MRKDLEWLQEEIQNIQNEKRYRKLSKSTENRQFYIFIVLLSCLMFFAVYGNAQTNVDVYREYSLSPEVEHWVFIRQGDKWINGKKDPEFSTQWKCRQCKRQNYCSSPDWRGDYHCLSCGTKMGDD